ncbi:MAG: hypothetical protein HQ555_06750 [Candidatus Aminicenantes bacterium]|nr:hypothetical protein [Candidatus Aminicenantes bacterium]
MKKPDMLILIAMWEFITALLSFIGISAIFLFAWSEVNNLYGIAHVGAIFGLIVAILMLFLSAFIALIGGIGLLGGKKWGRVLSIAYAAISLIRIPFGTVIGILVIIYLTKPDVRDYFETAKE